MESDNKNLLLLLDMVREINRLQMENEKSIDQMSDQITSYKGLFDSVVVKNNGNINQSVVREIRAYLFRFSILANPEMLAMYRRNKKNNPNITELLYGYYRSGELLDQLFDLVHRYSSRLH
ncbi:MAG: hypothetical protein P4L69_22635 [Desulfosporosinus sp.]|nr:hypothetical protein [Desulfosporosinus sp.]